MTVIVSFFTRLVHKYMPDAFVVAIALTILTVALAVIGEGATVHEATKYWGDGFWALLSFTMQMTVILVTGFILAKTPLVDGALEKVTGIVKTPRQAVVVATVVGILGCWFNWGFGLIVGSLVARKLAINVKGLHYPLAIAAAYSGLSVYGIGLSGTVPLVISTDGHFMESAMGIIPIKETIFSPVMLATSIIILLTLPFFNALLHPKDHNLVHEIDRDKVNEDVDFKAGGSEFPVTFSQKMNNSKVLGISIGLLGLYYIYIYIADGGALNLNILNFGFLFLGIILFASPAKFLQALNDAVKTVAGVIIQYPFYAGIMGILVGSGLMVSFSDFFTGFATAETLPFWSFVSGGVINILAPSGGGQWAVQGPVMIEAARELGSSFAATATAVQIGDQWTNMVQPFWLLPALAISGLKLKEIMGYLVLVLIYLGVIFSGAVLIWGGA